MEDGSVRVGGTVAAQKKRRSWWFGSPGSVRKGFKKERHWKTSVIRKRGKTRSTLEAFSGARKKEAKVRPELREKRTKKER